MGRRNYLVEGVSGTGKTSICRELQRRGYQAFNGDTDLAGSALAGDTDPAGRGRGDGTAPTPQARHAQHGWSEARVRQLAGDREEPVTFFCGGARNHAAYADVFDAVLVLEVDADTLRRRLEARAGGDEFGARPEERDLVLRLHRTGEDRPAGGVPIDATAPLGRVVDEVLARAGDVRSWRGQPPEDGAASAPGLSRRG